MPSSRTCAATRESQDSALSSEDYDAFHQQLRARYATLPPRLKQIADAVLASPDDVALGTVSSLAAIARVQPSTVVRFARTFDLNGFSEMQAIFRDRIRSRSISYGERVNALHAADGSPASASALLDGFYEAALASLQAMHHHMDRTRLDEAITRLAQARRIYILGLRRSMPVARYLSYLFTKMEISHRIIGLESGMEDEAMLSAGPEDAAIVISFTVYAKRTIELFRALEKRHVPIVAVTDSPASPVIPSSGLWLEVMEADFMGFRSNAATMALVMTLATAVAERRE
ncbi:MurR/RpiR family transcriptional regulator [Acetobacter sp. AN02]|uniref:MurR/RpiR family transcriptional regulator n=1 Tax=Acetobacter sp. AN02 TaxID=2894186 RepID=UPI0024344887|nr:MurR/RpiR family transcriptional regulator [Acetobacter sp. AN02]MDG6095011.1 MurR/RpiR family transcriptional regulator [Acetobacter sp. AN02]